MKKITAIIKPFKFDEAREVLAETKDISGLTVTEVRGFGRQNGHTERYRVDLALQAIRAAARTGKSSDGKISVPPIENVMRIRTNKWDNDVLSRGA